MPKSYFCFISNSPFVGNGSGHYIIPPNNFWEGRPVFRGFLALLYQGGDGWVRWYAGLSGQSATHKRLDGYNPPRVVRRWEFTFVLKRVKSCNGVDSNTVFTRTSLLSPSSTSTPRSGVTFLMKLRVVKGVSLLVMDSIQFQVQYVLPRGPPIMTGSESDRKMRNQ